MKFPLTAIALSCCAAWFHGSAAEPAPAGTVKEAAAFTVTAECQIITLPQKAALKLLPDLVDDSKIDGAFDRLQTMIAAGEAELAAHLIVKTQEGEKGESEAADEMRYPTEWEPPNLPDPQQLPKQDLLEIVKNWPLVGFTPTAFETRNLGPSIELSPLSHSLDGRFIEVIVSVKDVRFLRWDRFEGGKTSTGELLGIEKPRFYAIKNTSTLRLQSGQRILLGAHKIPSEKGLMELFLLRISGAKSP